jgi:hypothetical protein
LYPNEENNAHAENDNTFVASDAISLFVIRMGLLDWALQYWSILTDPLQHSIKANASYWSISKNYLKEANFLAFIAT